jgi:predicted ferric reductase
MKKALFFVGYALTPAIPAFLYLRSLGQGFSGYTASVALGIAAFTLIADQFILAARPGFAMRAVGAKTLLKMHQTAPIIALALAGAHKLVKEANGFSDDSFQASFGGIAWWTFAAVLAAAVLFMATTFLMKVKPLAALKGLVQQKLGLGYKRLRILHNISVAAALALTVHVTLASTSAFAANPVGIVWMLAWMALSLGLYLAYRLRGRKFAAA